jgi:hypothetical protein
MFQCEISASAEMIKIKRTSRVCSQAFLTRSGRWSVFHNFEVSHTSLRFVANRGLPAVDNEQNKLG